MAILGFYNTENKHIERKVGLASGGILIFTRVRGLDLLSTIRIFVPHVQNRFHGEGGSSKEKVPGMCRLQEDTFSNFQSSKGIFVGKFSLGKGINGNLVK